MKYLLVTAFLLAAAGANASVVMSEDFETSVFPPVGWSYTSYPPGWGKWQQGAGPYGACAYGWAGSTEYQTGAAILTTCRVNLQPNTTYYYRYDYRAASGAAKVYFIERAYCSGHEFYQQPLPAPTAGWVVWSGSFNTGIYNHAYFEWTVAADFSPYPAYAEAWLDNVMVAEEPFVVIPSTSLGRVKALYR